MDLNSLIMLRCWLKCTLMNVTIRSFQTSYEVVVSFALSFFLNSHLYFYFIKPNKIDDTCWNLFDLYTSYLLSMLKGKTDVRTSPNGKDLL